MTPCKQRRLLRAGRVGSWEWPGPWAPAPSPTGERRFPPSLTRLGSPRPRRPRPRAPLHPASSWAGWPRPQAALGHTSRGRLPFLGPGRCWQLQELGLSPAFPLGLSVRARPAQAPAPLWFKAPLWLLTEGQGLPPCPSHGPASSGLPDSAPLKQSLGVLGPGVQEPGQPPGQTWGVLGPRPSLPKALGSLVPPQAGALLPQPPWLVPRSPRVGVQARLHRSSSHAGAGASHGRRGPPGTPGPSAVEFNQQQLILCQESLDLVLEGTESD